MSKIGPLSEHLSRKARCLLRHLTNQSCAEATAIAEYLNDAIEDGPDDQEPDEFLVVCAEELRDWAQLVIDTLEADGPGPIGQALWECDDEVHRAGGGSS